jgi:hypothetical protein
VPYVRAYAARTSPTLRKRGRGGAGAVSDVQPVPRGGDIEAMQPKSRREMQHPIYF